MSRSAAFIAAFRPRIMHAAVLGVALALMDTLRAFSMLMSGSSPIEPMKFLAVLVIANTVAAAAMIAAITWAEREPVRPSLRLPMMATVVVLAAGVSALIRGPGTYLHQSAGSVLDESDRISLGLYLFWIGCVTGGLAAFYYEFWERAAQSTARLRAAELERQGVEQRVVESRLSVMKARIEPTFLFNSIATVQKLYRGNTDAAENLLDNLIVYLRAALPQMRGKTSSLGDEIHLAASYLKLHDEVFEGRLNAMFDVPDAARELQFPPMVLLPLIEDAVNRARAMSRPELDLTIAIAVDDVALRVTVTDDCRLTRLDTRAAPSLTSQEHSLSAYFGAAAHLVRSPGKDGGTRITLEIPHGYHSRDRR